MQSKVFAISEEGQITAIPVEVIRIILAYRRRRLKEIDQDGQIVTSKKAYPIKDRRVEDQSPEKE